ncbi:MAG: glycerol-3-phosphate dehydrogenase [Oscillospiraceae bacterium]|nr:glycerol-3-phosphate dehydrogenase [Oscillospiraceae bacterium]
MANFSVLGSGRWGSLIAWYLNKIGHQVTLWGKKGTKEIEKLLKERRNNVISFEKSVVITSDLELAINSEYLVISINAQNLRSFLKDLTGNTFNAKGFSEILKQKKLILCMKGIEETSGKRLSEIVHNFFPENKSVAVWVGPGHVGDLIKGIPTCMVVDSLNEIYKKEIVNKVSSNLIKCYYGNDLIGNEIGAAAKNVLGISAGILDALEMESLKGPLMARGAKEISNLIEAMGGKRETAYGLCHLGDFQATLFSKQSNNRKYGESLVTGEKFSFVAEGVGTSKAINLICNQKNLKMPICNKIHEIITKGTDPKKSIKELFDTAPCIE